MRDEPVIEDAAVEEPTVEVQPAELLKVLDEEHVKDVLVVNEGKSLSGSS